MEQFHFEPIEFAQSLSAGVQKLVDDRAFPSKPGEFTRWTKALKHWLTIEGDKYGFQSNFTDGLNNHEFMLDFVWWRGGDKRQGSGAVLGCESEFGNPWYSRGNSGLVAADFEKLLCFKAPFKLMIFDSYSNPEIQTKVIAELDSHLQDYADHREGEQYLVMDMCKVLAAWLCTIARDGVDTSLSLKSLI